MSGKRGAERQITKDDPGEDDGPSAQLGKADAVSCKYRFDHPPSSKIAPIELFAHDELFAHENCSFWSQSILAARKFSAAATTGCASLANCNSSAASRFPDRSGGSSAASKFPDRSGGSAASKFPDHSGGSAASKFPDRSGGLRVSSPRPVIVIADEEDDAQERIIPPTATRPHQLICVSNGVHASFDAKMASACCVATQVIAAAPPPVSRRSNRLAGIQRPTQSFPAFAFVRHMFLEDLSKSTLQAVPPPKELPPATIRPPIPPFPSSNPSTPGHAPHPLAKLSRVASRRRSSVCLTRQVTA